MTENLRILHLGKPAHEPTPPATPAGAYPLGTIVRDETGQKWYVVKTYELDGPELGWARTIHKRKPRWPLLILSGWAGSFVGSIVTAVILL